MARSPVLARLLVLCLCSSGLIALAAPASAATLTVPSGAFPTIQDAVDAAAPGDTIKIKPGTYNENVDILTDDLRITGANKKKKPVVVDGFTTAASQEPVFHATATNVQFDNMTIRNGESANLRCEGDGCVVRSITMPRAVNDDCINIIGNNALIEEVKLRACDNHAIEIDGDDAVIKTADVRLIDSDCINVEGDGLQLLNSVARNCEDGDGVTVTGDGALVKGNAVLDAASECYDIHGIDPVVSKNRGGNCDNAFEISGENMIVTSNIAAPGDDEGFDIDCGDETGGARDGM